MYKIKSNKGAIKRFKKTASGFKHKQSFRNHILTNKSSKRKRQLRKIKPISKYDCNIVSRMLPNL